MPGKGIGGGEVGWRGPGGRQPFNSFGDTEERLMGFALGYALVFQEIENALHCGEIIP